MPVTTGTAAGLLDEVGGLHRSLRTLLRPPHREGPGAAAEAVLGLLAEAGECRPGTLSCRMGTTASVLSRQLADLVDEGLVDRRPDPQDGRAQLVQVSAAGAELLDELHRVRVQRLLGLLEGWTDGEATVALRSVQRLRDSLRPELDRTGSSQGGARTTGSTTTAGTPMATATATDAPRTIETSRSTGQRRPPSTTSTATALAAVGQDEEASA